jgi:starvation-inducible DNA-binding protein
MLVETLKTTLADTFVLYFKAHSYHWNIEGSDFAQYHDFIGDFYADVFASVDSIAELIRTMDAYAPTSLARIQALTQMEEEENIPSAREMLTRLRQDNDKYLAQLVKTYNEAETASEFGVSNHIQDRIQSHEKHAWMLRAITK